MKNKRYIIGIAVTVVVIASLAAPALAALELQYPIIPGAPNINTDNVSLVQYIAYFFWFAVIVAGIIGVVSIIISGLEILIYAGSPEAVAVAKERIWGAVLGIILLMFSVILLTTLNPDLVKVTNSENGLSASGIFYMGTTPPTPNNPGTTIFAPAHSSPDTSTIMAPYTKLYYNCTVAPRGNKLVWLYNQVNFQLDHTANGAGNVKTVLMKCGDIIDLQNPNAPVLSFQIADEQAGAYFYLKDNCEGISSPVINTTNQLTDSFADFNSNDDVIKSMKIVSGTDFRERYGVVLNKTVNYNGECSAPVINSNPGSICVPIPPDANGNEFRPLSAYIIHQNLQWDANGSVDFKSDSMIAHLPATDIGDWHPYERPDDLFALYGNPLHNDVPVPPNECKEPDVECVESITPLNPYTIILYAQNDAVGDGEISKTCEVLHSDGAASFALDQLLLQEKRIYRMDIIPALTP